MGYKRQFEIGERFGARTVLAHCGKDESRQYLYRVRCDCGVENVVAGRGLKKSKSCYECRKGHKATHRKTGTRIYGRWAAMIRRCYNPAVRGYERYGGRGITVCEEWRSSFESFLRDMGEPPFDGAQIDRIDNDKGYGKDNCRWATARENNNNRHTTLWVNIDGARVCFVDALRKSGVKYETARKRIRDLGWSAEKALAVPVARKGA